MEALALAFCGHFPAPTYTLHPSQAGHALDIQALQTWGVTLTICGLRVSCGDTSLICPKSLFGIVLGCSNISLSVIFIDSCGGLLVNFSVNLSYLVATATITNIY